MVKKWFNIKSKVEDFHADDVDYGGVDEDWRHNFSELEACTIKKSKTERLSKKSKPQMHNELCLTNSWAQLVI